MSRPPRLWKAFRLPLAALLTATVHGCGEPSGGTGRIPSAPLAPRGPAGAFQPIIHTIDGRHFALTPGSFEPASVEHCREDGGRHLTSIFELSGISPIGRRSSLCKELAGSYLILHLRFVERPAIKVTTLCENGCVVPGGYYPPLGTVIRIPWSEISSIEFRRD